MRHYDSVPVFGGLFFHQHKQSNRIKSIQIGSSYLFQRHSSWIGFCTALRQSDREEPFDVVFNSEIAIPYTMSSTIYSVFFFLGLLVLVSSFSTHFLSSGSNQNLKYDCPSRSTAFQSTCKSPLVLMMSSQTTTVGDSQEVRSLFSKYCDKDSLIDKKTLESMPPFAEMLVSFIGCSYLLLTVWQNPCVSMQFRT